MIIKLRDLYFSFMPIRIFRERNINKYKILLIIYIFKVQFFSSFKCDECKNILSSCNTLYLDASCVLCTDNDISYITENKF